MSGASTYRKDLYYVNGRVFGSPHTRCEYTLTAFAWWMKRIFQFRKYNVYKEFHVLYEK